MNILTFYVTRFTVPGRSGWSCVLAPSVPYHAIYAWIAACSAPSSRSLLGVLLWAVLRRESAAVWVGTTAGRLVGRGCGRRSTRRRWAASGGRLPVPRASRARRRGLPLSLAALIVMVVVDGLLLAHLPAVRRCRRRRRCPTLAIVGRLPDRLPAHAVPAGRAGGARRRPSWPPWSTSAGSTLEPEIVAGLVRLPGDHPGWSRCCSGSVSIGLVASYRRKEHDDATSTRVRRPAYDAGPARSCASTRARRRDARRRSRPVTCPASRRCVSCIDAGAPQLRRRRATARVADYIPALAAGVAGPLRHRRRGRARAGRRRWVTARTRSPSRASPSRSMFALVCEALGHREVRERLGVNATGLPVRLGDGGRAGRRRADQPAGQLRRHRHHEPGPRADGRAEVGASCARGCPGSPAASSSSTRRCSTPSARPTGATRRWPGCSSGTAASTSTPTRPPTSTPGRAPCW